MLAPAAHAATGDIDTTWGSTGVASAPAGRAGAQSDPIVQPSGKVVVVGVNTATGLAVIERFNTNGSPDTSFGSGGEVQTDLAPASGHLAVAADPANPGQFQIATGTSNSSGKLMLERFGVDGAMQSKVAVNVSGGAIAATAAVIKSDGSTY